MPWSESTGRAQFSAAEGLEVEDAKAEVEVEVEVEVEEELEVDVATDVELEAEHMLGDPLQVPKPIISNARL